MQLRTIYLAVCLCILFANTGCNQSEPDSVLQPQKIESTVADPGNPPKKTSDTWVVPAITKNLNIGEFKPNKIVLSANNCALYPPCKVQEDFSFVRRSDGVERAIIRGNETDGASLPDFAVSYFGGRFNPEYLPAAIIHDHFCIRPVESFFATHRLFYEMLLASGVEQKRALIMYAGVLIGGPKWVTLVKPFQCPSQSKMCIRMTAPQLDAKYRVLLTGNRSALVRKEGTEIWEEARSTVENAESFAQISRRIKDGGIGTSPEQVEREVIQLKKGDPFFELSKTSRSKVSLESFEKWLENE